MVVRQLTNPDTVKYFRKEKLNDAEKVVAFNLDISNRKPLT